jgi:hypothetical protein
MNKIADGFPIFRHYDRVVDYKRLNYNPCDDIIFPSVIEAYKYMRSPLARYYMYYAPHNAPGGICLSYSDNLIGPWHEYPKNPVIRNKWTLRYAVSHVSSPHAIWVAKESKLFLFFHGENSCTRFAITQDGINFSYGGIAVTEKEFDCKINAFYARVFPFNITNKGSNYVMLLMCETLSGSAIYLAYSKDCRHWQTRRTPLISPESGTNLKYICAAWLWNLNNRHYILYHGDQGDFSDLVTDIYATEIDDSFEQTRFIGKVFDRQAISSDNRRVSDPCLIEEGDTKYLFISTGTRLNQVINLAIAEKGQIFF